MSDKILEEIINDLKENYNCHTIILYGSRARGDFNENSDYDIAAFSSGISIKINYAKEIYGKYLDAFIFPDVHLYENISIEAGNYIHLKNGIVLHEQNSFGSKLLLCVEDFIRNGPQAKSQDDLSHRIVWSHKMLNRISQNDIEGNYRRVWLLTDLLELYFDIRNIWYFGPKESFKYLQENDVEVYSLYKNVLKKSARDSENDLKLLLSKITKIS